MRGYESTRARYVLIGEADDGCCGHPWLTWGHELRDASSDASASDAGSASDAPDAAPMTG